jgi:hypothetical protein
MTIPSHRLFDDKPCYPGPSLTSESSYAFLSRASGPFWQRTRDLAEQWYAGYPDTTGDMRARFRQDDPHQHVGAWWELYIFTLFRCLGHEVTVHPKLRQTSKTPDFRISRDEQVAYVECKALVDNTEWTDSDCGALLLDSINRSDSSDFIVDLSMDRVGLQRPTAREIIDPIERWLDSLDWATVTAQVARDLEPPSRAFVFRDWHVTLEAWPVRSARRGVPGRLVGSYLIGNEGPRHDDDAFRRVVSRNGAKYGDQVRPMLLAILATSSFIDERDVTNALFGSIAVRYYQGGRDMPPPRLVRLSDGYWRPCDSTRGSRVAGVLFSDHLLKPWNPTSALPLLWLNPSSSTPLPNLLPFGTRSISGSGELTARTPSRSAAEVLGIDWDGGH